LTTETQEEYYKRKIEQNLTEAGLAREQGKIKFAVYFEKEVSNYKQALKNYYRSVEEV
jgi:hypothetical protein